MPLEFVFYDLGIRGFKSDRDGLNGLRKCLQSKSVEVVFFFATNRLFRKTYRKFTVHRGRDYRTWNPRHFRQIGNRYGRHHTLEVAAEYECNDG